MTSATPSSRRDVRPEIQALRAVAVLTVVGFHLWPDQLTGGYVGVDVFFVISGFLISSHLFREAAASGTVRLSQFYARRIRRLLPAALFVLAVTAVGVLAFVPMPNWAQFYTEIAASALYCVNWVLAANSIDYFASENFPSPVQHYWSLSVEEQFYLVWPLLILAVVLSTRRSSPEARRRGLGIVLVAIFVGCLVYSIVETNTSQQFAYFSTPAHGWEFAAGGLLALAGDRVSARMPLLANRPWLRAALSAFGFLAILASAVFYTGDFPFPGWIALLPVVGALAVIVAGTGMPRASLDPLVRWRPVQFVGDISYSLYLWHWPLIVIVPLALKSDLHLPERLAILVASVLLAWLTKRFIEDPVRTSPRMRQRRRTYLAAAAASLLVVSASIAPQFVISSQAAAVQNRADSLLKEGSACFGAMAAITGPSCKYYHSVNPALGADSTTFVPAETKGPLQYSCSQPDKDVVDVCRVGYRDPAKTVALVGDSHARHYLPALVPMLDANHWQLKSIIRGSCQPLQLGWTAPVGSQEARPGCTTWRRNMPRDIAAMKDVSTVIVSGYTRKYGQTDTAARRAVMAKGFADTWKTWTDAGKTVVVIADDPLTNKQTVPVCVAEHIDDPDACGVPRSVGDVEDPLVTAAKRYPNPGVTLIDLTDLYCDKTLCRVVIGGVVAYLDTHHLSPLFSASLAPVIDPKIERAVEH